MNLIQSLTNNNIKVIHKELNKNENIIYQCKYSFEIFGFNKFNAKFDIKGILL